MSDYYVIGMLEDIRVVHKETKRELWMDDCAEELNRLTARVADLKKAILGAEFDLEN